MRLTQSHSNRIGGRVGGRFADWVEEQFGIPTRLASLFSWHGSRLEDLPLCLAAMESGELTYTKLREFVKLVKPEDQEQWIEYAKAHPGGNALHPARAQRNRGSQNGTYPRERVG